MIGGDPRLQSWAIAAAAASRQRARSVRVGSSPADRRWRTLARSVRIWSKTARSLMERRVSGTGVSRVLAVMRSAGALPRADDSRSTSRRR